MWKATENIGEISGKIIKLLRSPEDHHAHPQLLGAYRYRNRVSHGYDSVDVVLVWKVATEYVPQLAGAVNSLCAAEPNE